MDLDTVILSGVSQTEEYRCHMILFKCGIFKKGTNELIYRIKLVSQMYGKKLWLIMGEGVVGINWEIGIDIYTPRHVNR